MKIDSNIQPTTIRQTLQGMLPKERWTKTLVFLRTLNSKIRNATCLALATLFASHAVAATANITVRIRNTDSVAHSFCIKFNGGNNFAHTVGAGLTFVSSPYTLNDADTVEVKWGVDQGAGSSNCSNKDYYAMREDNGSTLYTVVAANGNQSTPYFIMVKVSVTTLFSTFVNEGSTTTARITRTGSTSYALTVAFTTTGTATFSPSQDWSLYSGGTWVSTSVTIPSGVSSPTNGVDLTLYAWSDGVGPLEGDNNGESAGITLSAATNYSLGTSTSSTQINN